MKVKTGVDVGSESGVCTASDDTTGVVAGVVTGIAKRNALVGYLRRSGGWLCSA